MPRVVFDKYDQFENWLRDRGKRGRYTLYVTILNEIIAEPGVSTRTYTHALYPATSNAEIGKIEELSKSLSLALYFIRSYDWDVDKVPGARVNKN